MKTLHVKKYCDINPFYHGIMFHHFHDGKNFKKSYSSINKRHFLKIINYVGKDNILNPKDFIKKLIKKNLERKSLCLTFDDALKSQIKIVLPLLDKLNIKAFFFIYTDIYSFKKKNLMEPTRDFIQTKFRDFNKFYDFFWKNFNFYYDSKIILKFMNKKKKKIKKIKSIYHFYSIKEIEYRIIRDVFFDIEEFNSFMKKIFKIKNYKFEENYKKIFMTEKEINFLIKKGHTVGLHSNTHPHNMSKLNYSQQKLEYVDNIKNLKNINRSLNLLSMSHPTGSYNETTLRILKKLKIKIGFNSNTSTLKNTKKKINSSNLEIAREDCRNILNFLEIN